MSKDIPNTVAMPVKLINFYGIPLTVIEYNEQQYIKLRPVVEMLGLVWKRARENILSDENQTLFGVKQLFPVPSDVYLGELDPNSAPYGAEITPSKCEIYILYQNVEMYLMRVQTSQMRANGNELGADRLVKLQSEWAIVLHRYENGEVVQKQKQVDERSLNSLMTMRDKAIGAEKQRLTHLIGKGIDALGAPQSEDPQGQLI